MEQNPCITKMFKSKCGFQQYTKDLSLENAGDKENCRLPFKKWR